MSVTATLYPCHGEHFHGTIARIALEEGKLRKIRKVNMKYHSWCCQKCGEPIGWVGRFLFGGLFHTCTKTYRTVEQHGDIISYVGPKPPGKPVMVDGEIVIQK